ncbi:DUF4097 family beta strand repeat-containing protein [Paenibacillus sp. IHBB 10380]|uniref:DUF4097 family beta strand repeat-containing protein n=1 Tax=Paenibacillus sp. IHBB 10380 TaxID=1566358 RepID=UPI0005CF93EA|nr:DUF4097 family beta strand repeat-containing protein [Paenibacillus sp. IHBB 10380]AJS58169.1 hypothetical protein UB51_06270 [Paenibacillus sp. IHBB 10380]
MFGQNRLVVRKKQCIQETISDVSLDWITGDIHILQSENDEIEIIQTADPRFPESKLFRYQVNNGVLSIADGRKQKVNIGFNFKQTALEIYIPNKRFNSLTIVSVGSHLFTNNLDVTKCRYNTTSGKANLSGKMIELDIHAIASHIVGDHLEIEKLDLHATSSKINLSGKFAVLDAHSIGRSLFVRSSTMLQQMKSISTAANVTISIPDNEGFTFKCKKVSGSFKSDFSLNSDGDRSTYKNGINQFSAEVRGGYFTLCKDSSGKV